MTWRLAGSLVTLRAQINAEWPNRSKRSDGTIGDTAHQARKSDHNPNAQGVVTAFDCTHDPTSADMRLVAEALRQSQDPRIKYVIWDRRIFSSYTNTARQAWQWGTYTGSNPHTSHMHVSVSADPSLYDRTDAWTIGDEMPQFTDKQHEILAGFADAIEANGSNGGGFAAVLIKLVRTLKAWAA